MEVVIVMVIVGILASIAYPSYQQQILKANRTDGTTSLLELSSQLERFYTENYAYNAAGSPATSGPYDSPEGHYRINLATSDPVPATTATTYLITATAQGAQAEDTTCATLTLNHLDQKTPEACW